MKPTTTKPQSNPEPMQVRDLIAELQRHDPASWVHLYTPEGDAIYIDGFNSMPGMHAVNIRVIQDISVFSEDHVAEKIDAAKREVATQILDAVTAIAKDAGVKL